MARERRLGLGSGASAVLTMSYTLSTTNWLAPPPPGGRRLALQLRSAGPEAVVTHADAPGGRSRALSAQPKPAGARAEASLVAPGRRRQDPAPTGPDRWRPAPLKRLRRQTRGGLEQGAGAGLLGGGAGRGWARLRFSLHCRTSQFQDGATLVLFRHGGRSGKDYVDSGMRLREGAEAESHLQSLAGRFQLSTRSSSMLRGPGLLAAQPTTAPSMQCLQCAL